MKRKEYRGMEKAIVVIVVAAFILVMGMGGLIGVGVMVEGINQAHRWEEWSGQDDRKGAKV